MLFPLLALRRPAKETQLFYGIESESEVCEKLSTHSRLSKNVKDITKSFSHAKG